MVTSNDVPSICFMCVMEPASYALNDRAILNEDETIWMMPSVDPSRRFAEPVQRDESSDYSNRQVRYSIPYWVKAAPLMGSWDKHVRRKQKRSPPTA